MIVKSQQNIIELVSRPGYTSGSVAANAGNVARKLAVLFVLIDSEPRMHKKPVVFYLYAIWSVMEVVRCLANNLILFI